MNEKSIGRGIIVLSISSIILKLLSSIYMPILSLILKDKGVAVYNIGYNYFVFLFAITSLGFQPVITKLVVEEKAKKTGRTFEVLNESKRFLMILGGIVSILFVLLSKPLSIIAKSKEVMVVIIFLAPAILLAAILTTYRGFFQGDNDINELSISNVNIPLVIITSLGVGIFPKIIKGYVEKNKDQLIVQTSYCYKLIYTITIPSICGIMIFAKDIFKFLYGRDFGGEILIIGAISLVFMSFSTIQNIIIQGINQLKYIISVGLLSILIKTSLNLILIRIDKINVIGSVIATIVSLAIVSYLNHIKLEKSFEVKIPLIKQGGKSLIASIIMTIVLVLIRYKLLNNFIMDNYTRVNVGVVMLLLVAVGGIIYFLALLFIGGITKYELDTISPKIYDKLPKIIKNKIQVIYSR